jgi:hypothetical protein
MSEDLISLLIYLALGLVGVIASAYKNKAKKKQQQQQQQQQQRQQQYVEPPHPQVPRTFRADPQQDYEPELGPLIELFDIPKQKTEPEYESVEYGPSAEYDETVLDSQEASEELAGMKIDSTTSAIEKPVSEIETFEEGQSDIQKMIAKYDALRKQMEEDGMGEEIASGEIVSVEAEEAARIKQLEGREFFNARKAIIYSEILIRREF